MINRYSERQYTGAPIPQDVQAALINPKELRQLAVAECRAVWIYAPGEFDNIFTGIIGSYGKIRGASGVIALIVPDNSGQMGLLEAGYLGEQYVLRATALGLATCWVCGTFKYKTLMGRLSIGPNDKLVGLIAVGYAAAAKPKTPWLLHRIIKRKSLEQIATGELLAGDEWLKQAIEAVRIAPSAVNFQPWQLSGSVDRVVLSPSRSGAFVYVDLGIAMLHFAVSASNSGKSGQWSVGKKMVFCKEEQICQQ